MRFSPRNAERMFFERLGSTNEHLQKLARRKQLSEGTVVWTNFQTHGRGHGENVWESADGKNLLMSILLKPPSFYATDQFQISKLISLSLIGLVKKYCRQVCIKWPNDILVGKKKIAGVLIENTIIGNHIDESIAGIGLNINQLEFPIYIPGPTSLKLETGCHFDILDVMNDLICQIEKWYTHLLIKNFQKINSEYESVLFGMNEIIQFEQKGHSFQARITGVGQGGQLLLEMPDGDIRAFGFKEVSYRI